MLRNIQGEYGYSITINRDASGKIILTERQKQEFLYATEICVNESGGIMRKYFLAEDTSTTRGFLYTGFGTFQLSRLAFIKATGEVLFTSKSLGTAVKEIVE